MFVKAFNAKFQEMMVRSRVLSMLAAVWVVVSVAMAEAWTINGIYANWEFFDSEFFVRASSRLALAFLTIFAFIVRFVSFFYRTKENYRFSQLSWLFSVSITVAYIAYFGGWFDSGIGFRVYDMSRSDPILFQGPTYIALSGIRFLITSVFALVYFDEISPNN